MQRATYPLHPAQKDIYLDQLLNIESPHLNIGGYIKLKGVLDKAKFHEVINSAPKVFDAFQMRFDGNGSEPGCYYNHDYEKLDLAELDFSNLDNPEEEAKRWMQNRFNTPFVIHKDNLLFEQFLIKIAQDENWFFGRYHHLITDGYGFKVWVQYVAQKYKSLLIGDNLQFSYASYREEAIKASGYMDSVGYELDGAYWKDKIIEKPQKFLQGKYRHQNNSDKKSATCILTISEDQRKLFQEVQLTTQCGLQQLTIAALLIYFGKTADQSEFVFGIPIHKRGSKRLRNIVGLFSGVLPYKGAFQSDIKLIDLLKDLAYSQKKDYRHQHYLIGDLSKALKINSSEGYLCDIIINYELLNFQLDFGEGIQATISELTNDFQRYPLQLCWQDFGKQQPLELHINFQHQYFSSKEIELLSRRILFILEQFRTGLDNQIADINIIPDQERYQLESEFNDTRSEFPEHKTFVDLFDEQVSKTPDKIAVVFGKEMLTFRQLNER
ncbi:MAG: condensation domain-containing protein, partial [Flavisolibacter sp.]